MATNLRRKKVQIQQDDEFRYILTPTEHNYNNNLKNILLYTSSREKEKIWANRASLVGLFEVEWKTSCHNILVEFLNKYKLDFEHNRIKVMMVEQQRIINIHLSKEVFKICHTGETKVDRAEMSNARITLANIANRVLNTYNTNEGWVVKKMRSKYVKIIVVILSIIYQKDKVQYFNNKSTMMISKANHG